MQRGWMPECRLLKRSCSPSTGRSALISPWTTSNGQRRSGRITLFFFSDENVRTKTEWSKFGDQKEHGKLRVFVPGVQLKVTFARAMFKSAPHSPPTPTSAIRAERLVGDSRSAAEWTEDGSQSKRACGACRRQRAEPCA